MNQDFYPVILAGGSGTRFWPRSRRHRAKQVLALDGENTMIQQTETRLLPLAPAKNFWVITNDHLAGVIREQLSDVPHKQVIAEPAPRNTAPAIGLAAYILRKLHPDAIFALFPSDHVVADLPHFRAAVQQAVEIARKGENIVVMGVPPHRAETGYGYIELGSESDTKGVMHVRRFREKPDFATAERFVASGSFFWNAGIFVWSAKTLCNALDEYLPKTAEILRGIAEAYGTPRFEKVFAEMYPQCENISIDYAVLEPRSAKGEDANIYCVRADFGWNDLGSWTALYEHRAAKVDPNGRADVIEAKAHFALNSEGNYIYAPKKFVATIGVKNVVVVETDDAILITTREHAQDVGKVVKFLSDQKLENLV